MTFKKLLASAGAVALLSGAANAATIGLNATGAGLTAEQCVAVETDLSTAETGDISLVITATAAEFNGGNGVHTLTVTVTGATLDTPAVGDIAGTLGVTDVAVASSTTTSVAYTFNTPDSFGGETILVELPVAVGSTANDVVVNAAITNEQGTTPLQATDVSAVDFVPGFTFALTADALDSKINASDPTAFAASAPGAAAGDATFATDSDDTTTNIQVAALTSALIATYTDGDCSTAGANVPHDGVFAGADITLANIDASGSVTAPTQAAVFTNEFSGSAATALGTAFTTVGVAAEEFVELATDNSEDIAGGAVDVTVTLSDSTGAIGDVVLTTAADELNFTGADAAETFRWFAMASTTANSIIRCTDSNGFDGTETVQVTIANSTDVTDGAYSLAGTPTADSSEFVISAADVSAATGSTGRADITNINFVGGAGTIVCDRLLVNTTTGTVTPFGNQSN